MIKKWKLLKSEPILKSKWLSLYNHTYLLPNGKTGENYYHITKPDYTLIVAINSKHELILERCYRRGVKDTLIELPAGFVLRGESPENSAIRELKEETGYSCSVKKVFRLYPTPSFCNMNAFVVVAQINEQIPATKPHLAEDENLEVFFWKLKKIYQAIKTGEIKDMGLISAIKLSEDYLK